MADKKIRQLREGKKQARKEIAKKLETILAEFKPGLGEKKFLSRVKKASKLFTVSQKKVAKKKATTPAKKTTKVSPAPAANGVNA